MICVENWAYLGSPPNCNSANLSFRNWIQMNLTARIHPSTAHSQPLPRSVASVVAFALHLQLSPWLTAPPGSPGPGWVPWRMVTQPCLAFPATGPPHAARPGTPRPEHLVGFLQVRVPKGEGWFTKGLCESAGSH